MSTLLRGVYIVAAKRTPFGTYGGALKDAHPTEMAEICSRAAIEQSKVNPELIGSVTVGNVISCSGEGTGYISRHLALRLDLPLKTACLTLNRLCGSGFQAVVTAANDICLRDAEIALAAGSESMSLTPFVMRDCRFGVKFTQTPKLECLLWSQLSDSHIKLPMGVTAENLAEKYQLTREECDKFALMSQQRWKAAQDAGKFKDEIVPVPIKVKGKQVNFEVDEHPKPQTTIETLAKLPSVFKKDGTVTAGNASGVSDGAAALVLASEDAVKQHNLTPLARVVSYASVGVDPKIMGIGPVPSIKECLRRADVKLQDVDLIDVNEAFAPQFLAVAKDLGLDMEKTNVNGGAIALGHPVGTSGARITGNLVYELHRRNAKYAVGSACIGGGQGIAVLLEKA